MNSTVYNIISKRVPHIIGGKVRKDGSHYLTLSPVMGAFISLNFLAGEIYLMVDGKKTIDDIVNIVSSKYMDVSRDTIEHDICQCISDLESVNLLTVQKNF